MTTNLPPPQDLAAATFRGWGEVTTAWSHAAERWWATILEWATDECSYSGVNQTTAYASVNETMLLRGEFYRVDDGGKAPVSSTCVTITQTTDAALARLPAPRGAAPTQQPMLLVTLHPGGEVRPGGYRGDVVDVASGTHVASSLYVFVATAT